MYHLQDRKPELSAELLNAIQKVGKKFDLEKIILFGSRARGTNSDRSDIDLAISARDSSEYFGVIDAFEQIETLLMFDVIDMNSSSFSFDLNDEIKRDGVIIYEKV